MGYEIFPCIDIHGGQAKPLDPSRSFIHVGLFILVGLLFCHFMVMSLGIEVGSSAYIIVAFVYACEANELIGTVSFLVCNKFTSFPGHPYQLPPTPWLYRL